MVSKDSIVIKQYKNSQNINRDILISQAIEAHREFIVKLQKNQLEFGYGNDGKKIAPSYKSFSYAFDKHEMNSFAGLGNPDLKLSGDMYKGLDFDIDISDSLFFYSDVLYFTDLDVKYQTAFGLSAKSLKLAKPIVTKTYNKLFHEALNK